MTTRAIKVDRLYVGDGSPAITEAVAVWSGSKIIAVGSQSDVRIPSDAEIVDAPGYTLTPGLIDVHVHLAYSGTPQKRAFRSEAVDMSYPRMALRAAAHARATLEAGFTTVRDMNAPGGVIIDLRNAIDAGELEGPRIRACGLGLSVTGGHMDQPGFGDHIHMDDMTYPCDGPEAFRRGVRAQVKRGADFIKINVCVSSVTDPQSPYRQEMTDQEIAAAISEAHMLEKAVAAHTSGGPSIRTAVELGLDTVEHGHWLDDDTVSSMAQRGSTLVPTLLVNERNFDFTPEQMGATAEGWRWLGLARTAKWESLRKAHEAGVRVAVGTDAGFMLPHGAMNAREIELLVEGGLTPLEALTAATKNGAEVTRMPSVGTLEAGKLADLLLVKGDPIEDVTLFQDRTSLRVIKSGREVPVGCQPAAKERT